MKTERPTPTADTPSPQAPVFRAELRPHRSASQRTPNVVILGLLAVFIPTAIGFVAAGAWAVAEATRPCRPAPEPA